MYFLDIEFVFIMFKFFPKPGSAIIPFGSDINFNITFKNVIQLGNAIIKIIQMASVKSPNIVNKFNREVMQMMQMMHISLIM